ncbi:hypothetical protein HFD07_06745 [Staphylococcus arlettae]|nr:hypothetical protein [Staphylococcus arlettae]KAB2481016.1 hypothetical protein F9B39_01765 [Staphylococcus sp. CH99b_3]NKE84858.1 hypothetical protein [Staphylococcus arlettae]
MLLQSILTTSTKTSEVFNMKQDELIRNNTKVLMKNQVI